MAPRKTTKKSKQTSLHSVSPDTLNILFGIGFIAVSLLTFFSTQIPAQGEIPVIGQYFRVAGIYLFGEYFRYIFSPVLLALGIMLALRKTEWNSIKIFGIFGFFLSLTSLIGWFQAEQSPNMFFNIYLPLKNMIGTEMAFIVLFSLFLLSLYLIFQISYKKILEKAATHTKNTISNMRLPEIEIAEKTEKIEKNLQKKPILKAKAIDEELQNIREEKEKNRQNHETMGAKILEKIFTKNTDETENSEDFEKNFKNNHSEKKISFKETFRENILKSDKKIPLQDINGKIISKPKEEKEEVQKISKPLSGWKFPSIELLNKPKKANPISKEEIREKALIIQKTLLQFGIEVEMEEECVGPTVIQYRLRPAEGVKVSKIENLNKDLALALSAKSIRIQAPIPGMNLVGIEVPNDKRDVISIREVLEDSAFAESSKKLSVALGKDINGDYIVGDLAKMPHLLIAGQTGSGKSVGMNGIILSLLYKNTPAELQMIMVDPKQVELGMYDGIPHLLTPVITSPDKALNSLKWSVAEMERRFGIFREKRVKNLDEYNDRSEKNEKMPAIVFIIDELADLMMSGNKKEVEHNIARIAQKGRAAGMHIIIATQRPSVNVITGIIKANVPTRIAFTVASQIDSRTILDQMGAESLLGRGDMLYFPTGAMGPTRIQGMLVETDEIDNVVREIRLTIMDEDWSPNIPDTENIVREGPSNKTGSIIDGKEFDESEEIINAAIELVQSAGKCSTSMLQRHLKLGYGRAARVVDILEEMGIVGPADGSRPREVLQ